MSTLHKKLAAEAIGTAWLVIGGCGTAVFTGSAAAAALAFGLTVLTMAYAIGHVSGCHLNPAVTIGLFLAKKFDVKNVGPYIAAQIVGAIVGAAIIAIIVKTGHSGAKLEAFAANGVGAQSPGEYKLVAGIITELVMTFFFLYIILGATSAKAPAGFAPIAIGLGLTLVHLISIPITNTSVNPARSISQAIFAGGDYLKHIWVFIIFPSLGAAAAGLVYDQLKDE
ncbi:MAG: aquaporin Z [Kofleriaceae bacterium]|nr:MAG: aquaporin Z [Kofleriaceae bacterium]